MAWIESHKRIARHPKTVRLAGMLGITRVQTVGHLHFLWWWALDYADDGDLSKFDCADVAHACEWSGDAEELVDALVFCRWLDRPDGQGLFIHDWDDWSGKVAKRKRDLPEGRRAFQRAYRVLRATVLRRDGPSCARCTGTELLEIDHIVPIARGGGNELENLQVLCRPCNRSKGART